MQVMPQCITRLTNIKVPPDQWNSLIALYRRGNSRHELGQLYDKDVTKMLPRDLQASIAHYQKAREFGIDIKEPTDRAPQLSTVPGVR